MEILRTRYQNQPNTWTQQSWAGPHTSRSRQAAPWRSLSTRTAEPLGRDSLRGARQAAGGPRGTDGSLGPTALTMRKGAGSLSLLQGIFPTQECNRGLLHYRQILYQLRPQESRAPRFLDPATPEHHKRQQAGRWPGKAALATGPTQVCRKAAQATSHPALMGFPPAGATAPPNSEILKGKSEN